MNTFVYRSRWRALLLFSCYSIAFIPRTAAAQRTDPIPKAFEQKVKLDAAKMSMDEALKALTQQAQISILVDDEPILQNSNMTVEGSLHDVLDRVGDTFDYTWRVSKAGVVLMSKRFKNPNERPQMNRPEMLEMSRNIVRALTLVDYKRDEAQANETVKRLFQTLTPAQINVLEVGNKLRGSDLAPNQLMALQQAIFTRTFAAPLKLWEDTIPRLENLQRSMMQAKPRTPTPPTHDYFYLYRDAENRLHSFEIQHMIYGDNDGEVRTP